MEDAICTRTKCASCVLLFFANAKWVLLLKVVWNKFEHAGVIMLITKDINFKFCVGRCNLHKNKVICFICEGRHWVIVASSVLLFSASAKWVLLESSLKWVWEHCCHNAHYESWWTFIQTQIMLIVKHGELAQWSLFCDNILLIIYNAGNFFDIV